MAITEEQLDLLLEDEELEKYSKDYHEYRMSYKEFVAKRDKVYQRLGIEIDKNPLNHQERLAKLEELLAKSYISNEMYDKKLKRIHQDIKDGEISKDELTLEQVAKTLQELQEEMSGRFKQLENTLDRIEGKMSGTDQQFKDEVLSLLHSIDTKLGGRHLRLIKGRES